MKVNYLNNRDLLKEIHKSKNSFCTFVNPQLDHQFDAIVDSIDMLADTIETARSARAARLAKEENIIVEPSDIPVEELVFRVMTWNHIPQAPKQIVNSKKKKKKSVLTDSALDLDFVDDAVNEDTESMVHVRVNFPPFEHYRLINNKPTLVGRSHWRGDFETGEFSKTHGKITNTLALMFYKLCERYGTRANWRNYTYVDEMKDQALLQLAQVGLQFNEARSSNPFSYYTATLQNSFTRILNTEKAQQQIKDELLELSGMNPSWSRQNSNSREFAEFKNDHSSDSD